jgi:hypothetical protein
VPIAVGGVSSVDVSRVRAAQERAHDIEEARVANEDEQKVIQSEATKYSQVIDDADEHAERDGRSLVTRNHDVIRQWAEERKATPASVEGSVHDGHVGVLRFDFPGGATDLKQFSWDDWFEAFDARKLNFIYQEHRSDGKESNFFRLQNPDNEE